MHGVLTRSPEKTDLGQMDLVKHDGRGLRVGIRKLSG